MKESLREKMVVCVECPGEATVTTPVGVCLAEPEVKECIGGEVVREAVFILEA